jgi:peptidoglycan-N-acetylglucosamine deacetylase
MRQLHRSEITGFILLITAAAAFFIHPLLTAAFLLFYVVLCISACFFPQSNFLGPVISRGCTGKNSVSLTFDDGPSPLITGEILALLDRHDVKATFFVSGARAMQYPELIKDIIYRGHGVGNHSMNHDPLVMLKPYRVLYREVSDAQNVLRKMGVEALAFRPPAGIINPKLHPILKQLGLICVTFNRRALDAGNFRVKNLAWKILKKVKNNDIILLHDTPPRRPEDQAILMEEFEKILTGLTKKRLHIVPLSGLIGREIMKPAHRP